MRALFLMLITFFGCMACQPAAKSTAEQKVVRLADIELAYQPAVLETETPLELSIVTPADWVLVKAELKGLSMDMLTMPLFFRQQQLSSAVSDAAASGKQGSASVLPTTQWHTQFLLGACADPQMRWRLELHFRDGQGLIQQRADEFVVLRR